MTNSRRHRGIDGNKDFKVQKVTNVIDMAGDGSSIQRLKGH